MEISKIDPNFKIIDTEINGRVIKIPSDKISLFGLTYDEERGFCRMDPSVADKISPHVSYLNFHTSGGRIVFKTNSKHIKIHVAYDCLEKMYHMPLTGQASFSLNEIIRKKEIHKHTFALNFDAVKGFSASTKELDGSKMHTYIMYFPLYNKVKRMAIEIDKGSRIRPFNPYKKLYPIVYYGSSITQGGCASRPDNSYAAFVSRWTNMDFVNIGFTGNGKGEPLMADYISKLPMSVFVMDYDHNADTKEYLKSTHEPFFKTFRKEHPTTPVIFISAPNYYTDTTLYESRRQVIEETYQNALKAGDKNVYFIDGRSIYPNSEREFCTVDGTHPNDLGFYFFAKSIFKIIKNKIIKEQHGT